jgi:hypothetical protein
LPVAAPLKREIISPAGAFSPSGLGQCNNSDGASYLGHHLAPRSTSPSFYVFAIATGPARPGVNLNIISQTGYAANPPTLPLVGHPNISGLQA